jgi:hypothetical protein
MENELVSLQQKILDLESKLTFNKPQTQKQQPAPSQEDLRPASNLENLMAKM